MEIEFFVPVAVSSEARNINPKEMLWFQAFVAK